MASTEAVSAAAGAPPAVVEGQVWERNGRDFRVVYAGDSVNLREVGSGRFVRFATAGELTSTHRYAGNPLSDEVVLFRVSDLLRRSGVEDADRLIEGIESLVRFQQRQKAKAS